MKLVSWNVNGIRAAWSHGLSSFMETCNADIYCFQETKINEPFSVVEFPGYTGYWSFCSRKGYSGTVCLTRWKPIRCQYDMGDEFFDSEGRIITLEFPDFYLVNCYVPNSQRSARRHDYREKWDELLLAHLRKLRFRKQTIVCGDFNVPISDVDIYAENKWVELNAEGFQSTERENLLQIVNSGFIDSYRLIHPDEQGNFTWWSNRRFKRKENRGWRLDYFLVSESLQSHVLESYMLPDVYGSDHCPIILEIDISEQQLENCSTFQSQTRIRTYAELKKWKEAHYSLDFIKRTDMSAIWNSIDWDACENHLTEMQRSLALAARTRDWYLITKWQKQIVYSLDAKVLAVRHVCSTNGGRGVDCIKWTSPHEKMSAALSLTSKGYHAMPSRLLLIRSKSGKQRRIHVETYYDRAMQTLYAYSLDPVAETWGDRKSFAYRKGRSMFDVNEYICRGLSGENAPEWIFIGDVRKCYEHISHDWILKHIPMAEHVLWEFLKAGYVFAGELYPTSVGVGIGCSMSPIIANMTLDGLQIYIYEHLYPDTDREEWDYDNGNMIRYADDVIVMARSRETAEEISRIVSEFLGERGLELSEEKTHIINIRDGFDYMSRSYYKRGDHVFCKPSKAAVERFMNTMRETIENYSGSQKTLIEKLNRKISGFASYHKVSEAAYEFRQLDVYIQALLLELCEQRHPKWDRDKIIERYWYVDAKGRHCYALPDKREIHVKFLSDTLFISYRPVKTNLNPYLEPEYVEWRSKTRQIFNATGIYRSIWNRQAGKCYFCGRKIYQDEEHALVEVDCSQTRLVDRCAYVHKRCTECSVEYIDTDILPSSITDIMELLRTLEGSRKPISQRYLALSEYFRTSERNSITLTFRQMEGIIGEPLGETALRKEFWYRTGFNCISQCWLDNGYEIKRLHLDVNRRVVFHLTEKSKNTASVNIPEVIKYGRVPTEAKYEMENYFEYILKKYGL